MTVRRHERTFSPTQETLEAWARLSGDHNPLHVDPEYARRTRFGGTICHGHLTLAVIEIMVHEIVGDAWLRGGLLSDVRFRQPVRPGREYALVASEAEDAASWLIEVRESGGALAVIGRASITAAGREDHRT